MAKVLKYWQDEELEIIRAMVKEGSSAKVIGNYFGITRNAVIGVCRRRGIQLRSQSEGLKTRHRINREFAAPPRERKQAFPNGFDPRPPTPKVVTQRLRPRLPPDPSLVCNLFGLTKKRCHWPLWNGDNLSIDQRMFCGSPKDDGHPAYCHTHREIACRLERFDPRPGRGFNRNVAPSKITEVDVVVVD